MKYNTTEEFDINAIPLGNFIRDMTIHTGTVCERLGSRESRMGGQIITCKCNIAGNEYMIEVPEATFNESFSAAAGGGEKKVKVKIKLLRKNIDVYLNAHTLGEFKIIYRLN